MSVEETNRRFDAHDPPGPTIVRKQRRPHRSTSGDRVLPSNWTVRRSRRRPRRHVPHTVPARGSARPTLAATSGWPGSRGAVGSCPIAPPAMENGGSFRRNVFTAARRCRRPSPIVPDVHRRWRTSPRRDSGSSDRSALGLHRPGRLSTEPTEARPAISRHIARDDRRRTDGSAARDLAAHRPGRSRQDWRAPGRAHSPGAIRRRKPRPRAQLRTVVDRSGVRRILASSPRSGPRSTQRTLRRLSARSSSHPGAGSRAPHPVPPHGGEEDGSAMIPGQFDYVRPGEPGRDAPGPRRIARETRNSCPAATASCRCLKLRLAQPAAARRPPGRRRPRPASSARTITAHRRPGDPPPDPGDTTIVRDPSRSCTNGAAASAIRRSATGARSAGPSPTPTRPRTGRRSSSRRCATIVCRSADRRADDRGARVLPRHLHDGHRADRGPDRDPDPVRRPRAAGGAYEKLERKVGRLRHRRRRRPRLAGRRRPDRTRRHRAHRRRRTAVRGDRRRGNPASATPRRRTSSARPAPPPAAQSRPVGDVRGPVEYKRAMAAEMTLRALRRAVERAIAYA